MTVKINFDFTEEQLKTLINAFPEIDPKLCANEVSKFATEELIELLSGKKRYLSLSHQYIEWLEQINVRILPEIEFTPSRIMNQFNFPPGSAAYISRILRDRQHTVLVQKSKKNLGKKFKEIYDEYEKTPAKEKPSANQFYSISLTKREFRELQIILDEYEEKQQKLSPKERDSISYPDTSEIRIDYIKIKYTIDVVKKILALLKEE